MNERDHGERRSKWQDERLDDLADLARGSATRLDTLQNLVAVHDIQLIELKRDIATREDHRWSLQLMLLGVLLTSIGTLVVAILGFAYH